MIGQQEITYWIHHPESLNKDSLYELRQVLALYPYFQTARVLYLKTLFIMNSNEFRDELQKGALYVADMAHLFRYVEGERFAVAKHRSAHPDEDKMSASDRTLLLINDFLNGIDATSEAAQLEITPEANTDYAATLMDAAVADSSAAEPEVPQMKGQELIDRFIENSEEGVRYKLPGWNDEDDKESPAASAPPPQGEDETPAAHVAPPVAVAPLDTDESETEETAMVAASTANESEKDTTHAIPHAAPEYKNEAPTAETVETAETADASDEEIAEENLEDSSLSETLAKIYVKQQRYDKALEIIKKLYLKNPKKNSYFADQIRFLEKLIINTKSK